MQTCKVIYVLTAVFKLFGKFKDINSTSIELQNFQSEKDKARCYCNSGTQGSFSSSSYYRSCLLDTPEERKEGKN